MLAAIVGGIVMLAAVRRNRDRVAAPMFRLHLFRIRAFTAGNIATLLAALAAAG